MSNGIFWKYDLSLDLALVFLVACRRSGGAVGALICSYPTGCVARLGIFTYLCAFLKFSWLVYDITRFVEIFLLQPSNVNIPK